MNDAYETWQVTVKPAQGQGPIIPKLFTGKDAKPRAERYYNGLCRANVGAVIDLERVR